MGRKKAKQLTRRIGKKCHKESVMFPIIWRSLLSDLLVIDDDISIGSCWAPKLLRCPLFLGQSVMWMRYIWEHFSKVYVHYVWSAPGSSNVLLVPIRYSSYLLAQWSHNYSHLVELNNRNLAWANCHLFRQFISRFNCFFHVVRVVFGVTKYQWNVPNFFSYYCFPWWAPFAQVKYMNEFMNFGHNGSFQHLLHLTVIYLTVGVVWQDGAVM